MSLLADPDFLLQSLRLNYIRHVLPNHSVQSSLPGTGPYNLITFDPASPTLNSPYVVLAGLADDSKWPELSSGRSSPPLGLVYGREEAVAGGGSRRRAGGSSGLQYSSTIGKGVGGAGMRVGGRARSWKGRGAGQLDANASEENAPGGNTREDGVEVEPIHRRNSLETSIHHRRLEADLSNAKAPRPPPVVIHSPVRTPQDSPVGANHQGRITTPPAMLSLTDLHRPSHRSTAFNDEHAFVPEMAGSPLQEAYDEPVTPVTDSLSSDDEDEELIDESPLDFPSRPLSNISENAELSTSVSSPIPLAHHDSTSADLGEPSSLLSSTSSTSGNVEVSPGVGGRFASVASSGVSLFGVSRITSGLEGAGAGRDRSDSESSSLAVPPNDRKVGAIEEADELDAEPSTSPPSPAKNLRVARERRRVNISGRMLVPISEPANEEDTPPATAATLAHPDIVEVDARPRSKTEPDRLGVPVVGEQAAGTELKLRRKLSAPSLLVLKSSNTAPTSTTPTALETTYLPKPTSLSPLPVTPSRHQPSLTFPSRSSSAFTRTPLPQRSALTALLSTKSSSTSASNPFSTLYAALASRAPDALMLSVYFPHSKDSSKKIKVGIKKDVTVEEVIGAGLWAYWEEGREPKLEVGDEEAQGEETTKWNLRIVEDDGEVDEDFPALDRTRGISAFSFGEFAIVKATPQQSKDNQAKQGQIQRRPSRVLAAPKRSAPPIVATTLAPPPGPGALSGSSQGIPAASSVAIGSFNPGTMAVSSPLAIGVLLKVRLPPAPGVEAINTTINVPNDMYMSDVLDHICKKRGLDPKDWALVVQHNDAEIIVPLDRTVDSLGDRHNLHLVKRQQTMGLKGKARTNLQNTNPSASIFKRLSEPPQPKYQSASALTSTYQRYTVQRKLPMPLGRHARVIAIDGDYIHFMPSDTKGMFDGGGRTSSFHISAVHDCKVSKRSPASFKLLVQKDRVDKRYDFEAESAKVALEIVTSVKALMANFKREEELRSGRG